MTTTMFSNSAQDLGPSIDQNEFEVDDILNEIGLFADYYDMPNLDGKAEPPNSAHSGMTAQAPQIGFVPVSPSYSYGDSDVFDMGEKSCIGGTMKNQTSFSVPNPFTQFSYPISKSVETPSEVTPKPKKAVKKSASGTDGKARKRKISSLTIKEREERGDLTEEEMLERRHRNREHAKRSRQRKKCLTVHLQQSAEDLKAENEKLRVQIYAVIGQERTETIMADQRAQQAAQFISCIRNPNNRILDESTVDFLKSLSKTLED